jgi:hypothetical protein
LKAEGQRRLTHSFFENADHPSIRCGDRANSVSTSGASRRVFYSTTRIRFVESQSRVVNGISSDYFSARATGEPATSAGTWSKGYGAAGFSLFKNLTDSKSPSYIQGSDGYAVQYPAAMGTENQGAADMIKHLEQVSKACPQQKYALGGHSQGGFAVVNAVPKMSGELLKRITAITMFGSPACPNQVKDRCISFCNQGDTVSTLCTFQS